MSAGAAWAVTVGLMTIRDLSGDLPAGETAHNGLKHRLPYPSELVSSAIVYAPLVALGSTGARKPTTAIAWGLTLAIFLNILTKKPKMLDPVVRFATGGHANENGGN